MSDFSDYVHDFMGPPPPLKETLSAIKQAMPAIMAYLQDVEKTHGKTLLYMAQNGWYFGFGDSTGNLCYRSGFLKRIAEEHEKSSAEIDDALIRFFTSQLDAIETRVLAACRNREHLLKPVFAAHRAEQYVLSIPAFLAQTDGICKEMGGELFQKHKKCEKPRVAESLEAKIGVDAFRMCFIEPLRDSSLPIQATEKMRKKWPSGFNGLNRHMVLHGESLDYPTKINGFKALSLLNYVAFIKANIHSSSIDSPCAATSTSAAKSF